MSRLKAIWDSDRLRKVMVFVGIIVIFALLGIVVLQGIQQHTYTENAHSNTVALLNEHTQTLKAVAVLQKEVAQAFAKGVPELTAGQSSLVAKLDWITCALTTNAKTCGPAPP